MSLDVVFEFDTPNTILISIIITPLLFLLVRCPKIILYICNWSQYMVSTYLVNSVKPKTYFPYINSHLTYNNHINT